ncbi:MAG: SUMF1/EgtB/PvdO family nonheme iron enzyme [Armatimonadetes bacterium]|nr:SUMF1/EgtB/PvdO family nonheme iron enzyme [Armatimonadota bacterium]
MKRFSVWLAIGMGLALLTGASAQQPKGKSAKARKTKINPIDGAEMVWIPAGEFLMGSNERSNERADEKPPHKVYLDGYWIYKFEVTVAQYRKFCRATRRKMPDAPSWGWKDNHPIIDVDWFDATAYSKWAGVRLPTEAQWEKAARGTDGRKYPWGNKWDRRKCANSVGKRLSGTMPVGSYPTGISPCHVRDMSGNVFEWCADWFDEKYYAKSPGRNPIGPTSGTYRVLRGGSWATDVAREFAAAERSSIPPDSTISYCGGFRCAKGPATFERRAEVPSRNPDLPAKNMPPS